MKYKDTHTKLLAAQKLLFEPTTSIDKFNAVAALVRGIHPDLDTHLAGLEKQIAFFDKAQHGQVIELALEHLPEITEEDKSRKKALLLFIDSWRNLSGEINRVDAELSAANAGANSGESASHWGRIAHFAKGPFGILTILALGIVFTLHETGVQLVIKNEGCPTMSVHGSISFSLPGLSIPNTSITSGSSAIATVPPLSIDIDGTHAGTISFNALSFSATFQLPSNVNSVTLDGNSLLQKLQSISLAGKKEHELVISCL